MVRVCRWFLFAAAAAVWIASAASGLAYAPRLTTPEIPSSPATSSHDVTAEPIGFPAFTLNPRIGFFAAGDPINGMDPDGRLASPMRPFANMTRAVSGGLNYLAEHTDNPYLGFAAATVGSLAGTVSDSITPSFHANQLSSAYNYYGGGLGGSVAAANVYNPGRPVYNVLTGRELIYGYELSGMERAQAGLTSLSMASGVGAGVLAEAGINATLIAPRPVPKPPILSEVSVVRVQHATSREFAGQILAEQRIVSETSDKLVYAIEAQQPGAVIMTEREILATGARHGEVVVEFDVPTAILRKNDIGDVVLPSPFDISTKNAIVLPALTDQ